MPRKATLTNEQRLERKRVAERIRMNKIRSNPEKYAQWTTKRRQMYFQKQKHKRQRVYDKLSEEFTENAPLTEVTIKSENIDDESINSYDQSDEHSDGIPLSSLSSHLNGNETYKQKVTIGANKQLLMAYYTEHTDRDTTDKLETTSAVIAEPLIPQISLHECSEPLSIIDIPQSSRSRPKVSNEVPWSLFREFESSIKKELDSKDKIIEELTLLNVKYKTQIKLLNEEKDRSKNKCPYCDRKTE